MEKGISIALDVLSIIFLAISLGLAILRKKHQKELSGYIMGITGSVFVMLLSDLIYVIFARLTDPYSVNVAFGAESVYLIANSLVIFCWATYIGKLILKTDILQKPYKLLYTAVLAINLTLVVVNCFSTVLFRINEEGLYDESFAGIIIFTVLNYLSVIAVIITVLRYKDRLKDKSSYYLLLWFQIPCLVCEILTLMDDRISYVFCYAISVMLFLGVCEQYSSYREIDQIIDYAIQHNSFEVYYQPIYSLKEQRVVCCEALIRLHDKQHGFIPADKIIEAAEETGKIHVIGRNNFYRICDFIASPEFRASGLKWVNINMSMKELELENVTGRIMGVLQRKGISPDKICLEVTETAFSDAEEIVISNMKELSEAGIAIALDDLGTGHSNMYRLSVMPFKMIKLDRFLIQKYDNQKIRVITNGITTLLKQLNFDIVAEAVETEDQLRIVSELGVDYVQGYYYSRPLLKEDFLKYLQTLD